MGTYVNPGTKNMEIDIDDEFYVDKSLLVKVLNTKLNKKDRFICVSRPRRFGKTMAANMIAAYYSKGCDSHEVFSDLKIAKDESFEKYINGCGERVVAAIGVLVPHFSKDSGQLARPGWAMEYCKKSRIRKKQNKVLTLSM